MLSHSTSINLTRIKQQTAFYSSAPQTSSICPTNNACSFLNYFENTLRRVFPLSNKLFKLRIACHQDIQIQTLEICAGGGRKSFRLSRF